MGWQTVVAAIFQAGNEVLINSQGLFVYNGPAALGNLIVSAAPVAGVDAKGNAFPKGLSVTVGSIIGTSFQTTSLAPGVKIDTSGNIIVFNTHGAIIAEIAPAKDGLFIYADTGSATQGALIASIAGNSGTDPVNGTAYLEGIYQLNTVTNQFVQVFSGAISLGLTTNNTPSAIQTPTGGLDVGAMQITQGKVASTDQRASIALFRVSAGGQPVIQFENVDSASTPGLPLYLPAMPTGVTPAAVGSTTVLFSTQDDNGFFHYRAATGGDSNEYTTGHKTLQSAPSQLINSTSPVQIGPVSFNVAAGPVYHFEIDVFYSSTAVAGTPQIGWGGSSTENHTDGYNDWYGGGMTFASGGYFVGTIGGLQTGPTLSAGNHRYHSEFWESFGTAGTFILRGQCSIAADTWTVLSVYARMEPI